MTMTTAEEAIRDRWRAPDERILEMIRDRVWSSHNIPLTARESTIGVEQPLIGDDRRTRLIKELMTTFLDGRGGLAGKRLVDLGCLEGGLSFEMARRDMEVLGVEGRASNFEKCALIADYYRLPNLDFIHLDVKRLDPVTHGIFDVVLCCGLLYHLDDPVGFLETIHGLMEDRGVLVLDTHIAPDEAGLSASVHRPRLGPIRTVTAGSIEVQGRWYSEYEDDASRRDDAWTALSNERSFWLTRRSLITALYKTGFTRVFRIHGGFEIDTEFELQDTYSRIYCVAVKEAFFTSGAEDHVAPGR